MFRKNDMQQLNLEDPILTLPQYLRRNLEKSWATLFYKYIFSNIKQESFEAFQLLERLLKQQVETNELGIQVPIEGKALHSEILQNPSDSDATYREKYTGILGMSQT